MEDRKVFDVEGHQVACLKMDARTSLHFAVRAGVFAGPILTAIATAGDGGGERAVVEAVGAALMAALGDIERADAAEKFISDIIGSGFTVIDGTKIHSIDDLNQFNADPLLLSFEIVKGHVSLSIAPALGKIAGGLVGSSGAADPS